MFAQSDVVVLMALCFGIGVLSGWVSMHIHLSLSGKLRDESTD